MLPVQYLGETVHRSEHDQEQTEAVERGSNGPKALVQYAKDEKQAGKSLLRSN